MSTQKLHHHHSEVYCWRRSGVSWRMRASLGLARAQAATLCCALRSSANPSRQRAGRLRALAPSSGSGSLSEPPQDVAFSSLFCFFVLSACACSPDVTVTSYSPTPFASHRGILMQTIVLSKSSTKQKSFGKGVATSSRLGCMYVCGSRTNCCWLARLIRGLILSRIGPSSGRHYVAASNQGGTPP